MYEPPAPSRSSRNIATFVFRSPSPDVGIAARREQRVADDQAGGDALVHVAVDAAVVVGEPVEREVLDEPVEARRRRAPTTRSCSGVISSAIGSAPGSRKVEQLADLVPLALDRVGVGRLDARDEVVDLEHLDVRAPPARGPA